MSNGQPFPPLWLAWFGDRTLPLATVWLKYLRRFGVDRWYRFAKQRLHWTLSNLGTLEQSERWSDLMPLMSWQLWLAKDLVVENRLPGQSATLNLTPGRVAQSDFSRYQNLVENPLVGLRETLVLSRHVILLQTSGLLDLKSLLK